MDGILTKINPTISRFLDQTTRAFEDALQTGDFLSFRITSHFFGNVFYLFLHINLSS